MRGLRGRIQSRRAWCWTGTRCSIAGAARAGRLTPTCRTRPEAGEVRRVAGRPTAASCVSRSRPGALLRGCRGRWRGQQLRIAVGRVVEAAVADPVGEHAQVALGVAGFAALAVGASLECDDAVVRSEAHTSELQSLM